MADGGSDSLDVKPQVVGSFPPKPAAGASNESEEPDQEHDRGKWQ